MSEDCKADLCTALTCPIHEQDEDACIRCPPAIRRMAEEYAKARPQRVCPCGAIVIGPASHPCDTCGDTSGGRHVYDVFMEMRAIIERLKDDALADRIAGDCHDKMHDDRHCPTCSARLAGIMSYRVTILGEGDES